MLRMIAAIMLAALLAGCAIFDSEVEQEPRADAILATRVKADLLEVPELNAAAITVESNRGTIKLTGFVDSRQQRQRAERIAREVDGVEKVINELEVKE